MLPASNRGAGQNIGFPDVCLTPAPPAPPVPVPYPNIGMNAQALGFSPIVKVSMVNALNMGSTIAMTSGDEAGAAHPTIKGQGKWTMGNPIVNIDRLPAIHLACPSTGNMMNNGLGLAAVPSAVNVTYCYANGAARAVGTEDLEQLAEAMRSPAVRAELLPGGVALLEICVFAPGLATDVFRALRQLEGDLVALLLDLRGCPGGDLDAAFALAESLLPAGAVIAQLIEEGDEPRTVVANSTAACDLPLVLLLDRRTASAAEVFAAAMKANRRALLAGERSYGKRAAQRLVTDPRSGAGAFADVASWSMPGEAADERQGVAPDVELLPPLDPAEAGAWLKTAWALSLRAAAK